MKTYFSTTKTFAFALVTLFATSFTAPAFAAEEDEKKQRSAM
ncbi:hypothetical protein [Niabella hibiscisoli]|nr:hypothetical protein [Niabella hibiscisoli]